MAKTRKRKSDPPQIETLYLVREYREWMANQASMRALDVWYDKIPAGEGSAHSDQKRSDQRAFLRALREGRIEALVDD